MKKHIILLVALSTLLSCAKKSATTTPPPTTTSTTMSAAELALVGNWTLRKTIMYNSNHIEQNYCNYYSPTTCYLNLENTLYNNTNSTYYTASDGLGCSPGNTTWYVDQTLLNTVNIGGSNYNILYQTTDTLVLTSNTGQMKYYLNKTSYSCTQSAKEQAMVKNWILYKKDYNATLSVSYTTTPLPNLNLQNTWYNNGTFSGGWSCTGSGSDFGASVYWEIFGIWADSLCMGVGTYYHIDTLNASALCITSLGLGYRYHFH
ncbi:MAG: hypothetical protein ACYDCN_04710 [Bacteroidia bacterium]